MRPLPAITVLLTLSFAANLSVADCIQGNCVNGQGTYTSSDGNQYVGEFEDNLLNGKGILTFADGSVESGLWENGGLVMTQAELDAEEAAAEKYKRMYNACLLDKAMTVDMSVASIATRLKETCAAIARKPSFPDEFWYD